MGSFQCKGSAVGRADGADRVKMIACIQPLDLPAGIHRAAGRMQHQLTKSCRHRCGVCGQTQKPQRHRRATFDTVFQRGVHQALIGKGEGMLYSTGGRCGGQCLAVPQFQQIYAVPCRQ